MAVLTDALRRIAEGECVLDPTIVSRLVRRPREESALPELTPRELEVLGLMAEGHSNRASATGSSSARKRSRLTYARSSRSSDSARCLTTTAGCWRCSRTYAGESRGPRHKRAG